MSPSCILLNTFDGSFIAACYREAPQLAGASYADQQGALLATNFGASDFYAAALERMGWRTQCIVANAVPLQHAWAMENEVATVQGGQPLTGLEVAAEQVFRLRPDVLYVQEVNHIPTAFLEAVRPYIGLLCGQVTGPTIPGVPYERYSVLLGSSPEHVLRLRAIGLNVYDQPLAFSQTVLAAVGDHGWGERDLECSFIGSVQSSAGSPDELLENLARTSPTMFWGDGAERLAPTSAALARHGGPAWGNAMFGKLARSRITIHRHGEDAGRFASEQRLFDATGCGALLITDHKDNLQELFAIGEEVVAYRSQEECVALVAYYLEHPEAAQAIARAGQARTHSDHSHGRRMQHTAALLERHVSAHRDPGGSTASLLPTRGKTRHNGAPRQQGSMS